MDDDAAIRAALLEAREAGDITITQYLNELKNLRAPGDAATAGGSSHASRLICESYIGYFHKSLL